MSLFQKATNRQVFTKESAMPSGVYQRKTDWHPANYKGGTLHDRGYRLVYAPSHPRANGERMREHILIAEKALQKFLPPRAAVHHVNEIKHDNRRVNLVICEDKSYHLLLPRRRTALLACGNVQALKCVHWGKWDMTVVHRGHACYHRHCAAKYYNNKYHEKRRSDVALHKSQ